MDKVLHLPLLRLARLAKNYRGITLTSITAKIYNALLRNCIEPKIEKILWKNQNGFSRNRSTASQILTIHRILEDIRVKNLQATILLSTYPRPFTPYKERRCSKYKPPTAHPKKPS